MKNKICLFCCILFIGCNIQKNVVKSETLQTIEKKVLIDTTIKIEQPIKDFQTSGYFDEPIKIENENFVFKSSENYITGKREYDFKVKKDSIKTPIKVYSYEKTITKIEQKAIDKKTSIFVFKWQYVLLFALFVILIIWLEEKYRKNQNNKLPKF